MQSKKKTIAQSIFKESYCSSTPFIALQTKKGMLA
jgi:hypothetical protein